MAAASAKCSKCKAANDAKFLPMFGQTSARWSTVAEPNGAKHSAEFFSRTLAFAELWPISVGQYEAELSKQSRCTPSFVY